jgi:tetratricopeptide (TPR) repeat protein
MGIYAFGAVSIVAVLTLALVYILKRNNLLSLNLVVAIGISSIIICFGIPFIFLKLDQIGFGLLFSISISIVVYIIFVLVATVGISMCITEKQANELWHKILNSKAVLFIKTKSSSFMSTLKEKRVKMNFEGFKEIGNSKIKGKMDYSVEKKENIIEKSVDTEQIIDKMGIENVNMGKEDTVNDFESDIDYYDQNSFGKIAIEGDYAQTGNDFIIDNNFIIDEQDSSFENEIFQTENVETNSNVYINESRFDEQTEDEVAVVNEVTDEIDSYREIPEESENQNSGKNNIENDSIDGQTWTLSSEPSADNIYYVTDFDNIKNPDVNDYIDEAFRLKSAGDYEGAILHYMYALDKKPEKDAIFWIVLDTCVLYKELGQVELAKEILESYVTSYGDVMSLSIRTEIEKNLSL